MSSQIHCLCFNIHTRLLKSYPLIVSLIFSFILAGTVRPQEHEIIIKLKNPVKESMVKNVKSDSIFWLHLETVLGSFQKSPLFAGRFPTSRLQKSGQNPLSGVFLLRIASHSSIDSVLAKLNSLDAIEYACINKVLTIDQTRNDPEYSHQWGLKKIHIEEAWQRSMGSPSTPVVVIDTGIDRNHEDLQGQIWVNPGEDLNHDGRAQPAEFNGIDDDGNGFIDDLEGWDFVDAPRYPDDGDYLKEDNQPEDENGHGTAVSGIIAARAHNGIGIAGVAPETQVVNLRSFTSKGVGEEDDVAAAILYAVAMGFRIINMSFGDIRITRLLQDVIRFAYQNDVILIASSGNGGDNQVHYPSGLAETIAVGATTAIDTRASFSSFGSSLDLVAPGNEIVTTTLANQYKTVNGTSAAAPFVSGLVALLVASHPEMSPEMVRERLEETSDDLGDPGWDFEYGAGRIRADRAVSDIGSATVKILAPHPEQGFAAGSVWVVATCAGALISGYCLAVGIGTEPVEWSTLAQDPNRQIIADTVAKWQVPAETDTIYTLRLQGFLRNGSQLDDYVSVHVDHTPPEVTDFTFSPILVEGRQGYLYHITTDDKTRATIYEHSPSFNSFQEVRLPFENTRHSNYLLANGEKTLEFYFLLRNRSGLEHIFPAPPDLLKITFTESARVGDFLLSSGTQFPPGYFLGLVTDFDRDGRPELVQNEYRDFTHFGNLVYREIEAEQITLVKDTGYSFIPRDVGDVNRDGRDEVLAGAGNASVILAGDGLDPFPDSIVWVNTADVWAGRLFDFNNDDFPELLAKVGNDWKIWRNNQDYSFTPLYDLPNQTTGNNGTGVPHVEIGDFDNDGNQEILYGDFDGDILLFEVKSDLQPALEWRDRLPLIDAIDFLSSGDFDGDGVLEFAAGCHSPDDIDLEHQFDDRHWLFRIYDFTSGQYHPVWEQRFSPYSPPRDFDSGLGSGDVNQDGREDLLISISPTLYWISWDSLAKTYTVAGIHQPVRSNTALVGDFNRDGTNALIFNAGDWGTLLAVTRQGPRLPLSPHNLQAVALDSGRIHLSWENPVPPDSFQMYRGTDPENLNLLVANWKEKSYLDTTVVMDRQYWYRVAKKQGTGTLYFSNLATAIPHHPARVHTAKVIPPNQLLLSFSRPMSLSARDVDNYRFHSSATRPETALLNSNQKEVLLSWPPGFHFPPQDTLLLTAIFDSSGTPLDSRDRKILVKNFAPVAQLPYIVRARFVDQSHLQIEFSESMELQSLLKTNNYRLEPNLAIQSIRVLDSTNRVVQLEFRPMRPIGPIGVRYELFVSNLRSDQGLPLNSKIGNRVSFLFVANDLSSVYVYPNPARTHLTFARLTRQAEIEVYNSSGILIRRLQVATQDGGIDWDLCDRDHTPIPAGVYIFRVFNERDSRWGKFAVVR